MRGLLFYRPIVKFTCMGGQNLSPESEFAGQRAVADRDAGVVPPVRRAAAAFAVWPDAYICCGFLWPGWCIRGGATRWWSLPRAGYSGPAE
eukprot:6627362-Prymnesium_polylepis.1